MIATPQAPSPVPEQRLVLHNVGWREYQNVLAALNGRRLRLTYDRGRLELMAPSYNHERARRRLGRLVDTLAEELSLPIQGGGSTTFSRQDLERGLEPDECYYIAHEPQIRGRNTIDLERDPPPDLALEIDITRSSLPRHSVYAALGVPEVWRYDGKELTVYQLGDRGEYAAAERSGVFPALPVSELAAFLRDTDALDEMSMARSFRTWLRGKGISGAGGP